VPHNGQATFLKMAYAEKYIWAAGVIEVGGR
jgi:hypothetical protein